MRPRHQHMSASRPWFPYRNQSARRPAFAVVLAATCVLLGVRAGAAQQAGPKIWDVKLGTPVQGLPLDDFVDPACGTNGGPPSRVLASFADFALCPLDRRPACTRSGFATTTSLNTWRGRGDRRS